MEQEKLQPIDLEVLRALFKQAYLPKTADKISKDLNIVHYHTLKIFDKLEKKAYAINGSLIKRKKKKPKTTITGFVTLNDLCKDLCIYLKALKGSKTHKKDQQ
ncbi:hypothetical protein HpBGD49_15210 [Helicobacter pylori]